MEMFKKHDKSLQDKICVRAYSALLAPEDIPLAVCRKKINNKIYDHLKTLFNVVYYTA
jgi:hypothetical protein